MFGNEKNDKKLSLLMLADQEHEDAHLQDSQSNIHDLHEGDDPVDTHRRARSSRRTTQPNSFLAALGMQTDRDPKRDDQGDRPFNANHADAQSNSYREFENIQSNPQPQYETSYTAPRDETFKPLIDPRIMLSAFWRWRWAIVGLTILGGVAGAAYAVSQPKIYTASTQVIVDPRQVKLVERDLTPEFLGNEAALSIVDSQLESVLSTPVLRRVVTELNLDQDPEFSGSGDGGIGLSDGITFVRSLFSGETALDTSDRHTIENLRRSVWAERTPRTFVFSVYAESESPNKAAEIANTLTSAFINNQNEKQADAAKQAANALGGQLSELKEAVEDAEQRAEEFAQDNNLRRVEGLTLSDTNLVATSNQLTEARAATIRAQSLADAAQDVSLDDAISGGLPPELVTTALTTFRSQYSSLAQNAASLEAALGPRHPRLEQAIATRDSARAEVAAELRRIVAGTQSNLRRAVQNEQEIASALARAKSEAGQDGDALIQLRELESEIGAARTVYENALLRLRETNQLSELTKVNANVLAEADVPGDPSSTSRKLVMAGGAMGGLILGLAFAFLAGVRDIFRPENAPQPSSSATNGRRRFGTSSGDEFEQHPNGNIQPAAVPVTASSNSKNDMYPAAPYYPYAQNATSQDQQQAPARIQPQHMGSAQQHPHYPQQREMQQPQYQQQWPDQAAPYDASSAEEDAEMEELRRSVQDIRDVVEQLAKRRVSKRRFG